LQIFALIIYWGAYASDYLRRYNAPDARSEADAKLRQHARDAAAVQVALVGLAVRAFRDLECVGSHPMALLGGTVPDQKPTLDYEPKKRRSRWPKSISDLLEAIVIVLIVVLLIVIFLPKPHVTH
jgi:hypothetical protein